MESLFDQLKSEPPINLKNVGVGKQDDTNKAPKRSPSPVSFKDLLTPNKIKKAVEKRVENSAGRRESMPPPATNFVAKNVSKSRSLSPPKGVFVKPFKVLLERKKVEEMLDGKSHKLSKTSKASTALKRQSQEVRVTSAIKNGEKSPKKATPTKAQQKLFDPAVLVKAQQLTELKVKRCKVRLLRQDLTKLQREFHAKRKAQNKNKISNKQLSGKNRTSNSPLPLEKNSPPKRSRPQSEAKDSKQSGFFIKLNALTRSPKSKAKVEKSIKEKKLPQKLSAGSIAKRVNAAAAISSTKPTKFTRTQLIKMYGKRVFCSRVKMERCTHPMMLIFESNARARRLQAKRSKSKNLSVSFREQVEIFGDSSDSEETDFSQIIENEVPSTSQAALKSSNSAIISLTATPARLKKVENGKVVDDIELDPSLFVAPAVSSTPYPSPGRKKREKKSFSPLKGDGSPSPRKEQLKLANEKMPPSSLRRLTADEVDEEDDEDDECEYIVPIEIPERRISRTSSANAVDDAVSDREQQIPIHNELQSTPINAADTIDNTSSVQESSGESFASAVEQPIFPNEATENIINGSSANSAESIEATKDVVVEARENATDSAITEMPKLTRIDAVSPTQSLNSLNDIVDSLMNTVNAERASATTESTKAVDEVFKTNNGAEGDINDRNAPDELSIGDSKLRVTLDDDISLQLFVDEDTTVKDSEIVDGIVQERIDEISKNKQLSSPNEASANLMSSNVSAE
ncbi:uncharacterized protein LOC129238531 isoform X1 [Anastrepha obliqua]|uniref:uncharacterized protein LOC129238531 isoform X1 n=1 Tax=Anastrepha obliqua TaxID=95512 RepID=UPI002409860D|nr:uncharacterized protein LOC129238531 isoform X1 [Anastrepha obliqua]XP_054729561.1 uncharacterized protein LOC129238531 isoform X1 [Anastrepha obliqua]